MSGPVIGITTYGRGESNRYSLPAEYIDAVRRAGGVPVLLPPVGCEPGDWLDLLDALILSGGGDIDPAHYGGGTHEPTSRTIARILPKHDVFQDCIPAKLQFLDAMRLRLPSNQFQSLRSPLAQAPQQGLFCRSGHRVNLPAVRTAWLAMGVCQACLITLGVFFSWAGTVVWYHPGGESGDDRDPHMARLVTRLVMVLAFIGIAYWYWTGPYENSVKTPAADDPKQNAEIIQRCIANENFAEADGYRGTGEDAEKVCADENNLSKIYGKWYHR